MLKSYPAIFHKEKDGSFWIEFPEFGGGTQGTNVEETLKNAREMLESVLATYIDEELNMPKTSNITTLSVKDGFVSMIQAALTPFIRNNKAVRKNVTVPEWLVRLADREKINYSEVLTQDLVTSLDVSARAAN